MSVFRSIVFSAVVAGPIVGVIITVVQQFGTVPLILKAEIYEQKAEASAGSTVLASEHAEHDHGAAVWEPEDGLERNLYTAAANILTAIGFSLLLGGFYALRGQPISWREGILWGLAGFAVFTIAPGLGLPPELPGVPAAPLLPRQLWWVATALATACGIGLLVFRRSVVAAVLGIGLILAPHLIGAPHLPEVHTSVPELLSQQFAVAVTLTSFLFWTLLGSLTGLTFGKFSGR